MRNRFRVTSDNCQLLPWHLADNDAQPNVRFARATSDVRLVSAFDPEPARRSFASPLVVRSIGQHAALSRRALHLVTQPDHSALQRLAADQPQRLSGTGT